MHGPSSLLYRSSYYRHPVLPPVRGATRAGEKKERKSDSFARASPFHFNLSLHTLFSSSPPPPSLPPRLHLYLVHAHDVEEVMAAVHALHVVLHKFHRL